MKFIKIVILSFLVGALPCVCMYAAAASTTVAKKQALLPIPADGATYTLGALIGLINENNPNQTSNFLVPTKNGVALTDAQCWAAQGSPHAPTLNGSASASLIDFTPESFIKNKNIKVQLCLDSTLLSYLVQTKRLSSSDSKNHGRIWLYFVYNGYRFYLNDPFPGGYNRSIYPAAGIIAQWDFITMFPPQ